METIKLSKGLLANIDRQDSHLGLMKWCAVKVGNTFYAMKKVKGKTVLMHHAILGKPIGKSMVVDHIDGNGLNNLRSNLRIVSQRVNSLNNHRKRVKSAYHGVHYFKGRKRPYSKIKVGNKEIYLGQFDNEEDAHMAYQKKLNELNINGFY